MKAAMSLSQLIKGLPNQWIVLSRDIEAPPTKVPKVLTDQDVCVFTFYSEIAIWIIFVHVEWIVDPRPVIPHAPVNAVGPDLIGLLIVVSPVLHALLDLSNVNKTVLSV
jgi:hypothetical protein